MKTGKVTSIIISKKSSGGVEYRTDTSIFVSAPMAAAYKVYGQPSERSYVRGKQKEKRDVDILAAGLRKMDEMLREISDDKISITNTLTIPSDGSLSALSTCTLSMPD